MYNYNWSYEEVEKVVRNEFENSQTQVIHLDVEHADKGNINAMVQWLKDLGYKAEELPESELIRVKRDK